MELDFSKVKKTPFYDRHVEWKGNIVDFSGWALPINYPPGIIAEHQAVRDNVGLFDVSHMGEIRITGPKALDLVQKLVSNDVSRLADGQAQYVHMLYPNGGVVDDLLAYKLGDEEYYLVVNAANTDKDFEWIEKVAAEFSGVEVKNESAETAELALQGPAAEMILQQMVEVDLSRLGFFRLIPSLQVGGVECLVSRTGYTGEDGFEIFCRWNEGPALWDALMRAGKEQKLQPVGLGARDSLRFEAALPLYGQELGPDITPLEAGLGRFVALDKDDFIGREALLQQKEQGLKRVLVGFEMLDRGIARSHYPIVINGEKVGEVTTGSYAPALGKNLGMAFVPVEHSEPGTSIGVEIRGRVKKAEVVKLPFYKRK